MKVILLQDVKDLGKKGALVNVSDGYARNYLFPRHIAAEASKQALNELDAKNRALEHKKQEELAAAENLARTLSGASVKITAKAGQNGRLFGSVTSKEIAEHLSAQLGVEIDRRKITVEDIKNYGTYEAEMKFYPGVSATFYVIVGE